MGFIMFAALYTLISGFISALITTLGIRVVTATGYIVLVGLLVTAFRTLIDSIAGNLVADSFGILSNMMLLVPANAAFCVSAILAAYVFALGFKYVYGLGNMLK